MQTVSLPEAQQRLAELVRHLAIQGDLVITDSGKPVAMLSSLGTRPSLKDLQPQSVGALLRPFPSGGDDLLGEMIDSRP
jgi:antitoxin (DNA-binding transcriptional repressor) of toxin-antitoxin stability system